MNIEWIEVNPYVENFRRENEDIRVDVKLKDTPEMFQAFRLALGLLKGVYDQSVDVAKEYDPDYKPEEDTEGELPDLLEAIQQLQKIYDVFWFG